MPTRSWTVQQHHPGFNLTNYCKHISQYTVIWAATNLKHSNPIYLQPIHKLLKHIFETCWKDVHYETLFMICFEVWCYYTDESRVVKHLKEIQNETSRGVWMFCLGAPIDSPLWSFQILSMICWSGVSSWGVSALLWGFWYTPHRESPWFGWLGFYWNTIETQDLSLGTLLLGISKHE